MPDTMIEAVEPAFHATAKKRGFDDAITFICENTIAAIQKTVAKDQEAPTSGADTATTIHARVREVCDLEIRKLLEEGTR